MAGSDLGIGSIRLAGGTVMDGELQKILMRGLRDGSG